MENKHTHPNLSRRDFMILLGAAGVTSVGAALLDTFSPWQNYDEQSKPLAGISRENTQSVEQKKEIIRYAILAANGHNTQPWKFAITDSGIQIHPDYSRRLAVVDPLDRELWISLGCAAENLVIAAKAAGYAAEVTYPGRGTDFINVLLSAQTPQAGALFAAIPFRQNTRSEFSGQAIKTADYDRIQKVSLEPGIGLRFLADPANMEIALDYVTQGNMKQYASEAFIKELIDWLRFNKKEILAAQDGLYSRCSGNPEVPRFIGQAFVTGTKPQQQADLDAKKIRSSAGLVVVTSESDDITGWVRTGQVYERLALTMTSLNIKSALLNQPIEVADVRSPFQSAVGLGTALPQLLVRFGYAEALPRSIRRPVDQVLLAG